ncbi:MAG: hypothetical protein HC935_10290 [Pseudanabaena sp. SU_2_4]|nr:hypothetical protein [Pseudanabaena sp. SU_2_4]NKB18176.1 hypothetical protein [Pseudanabaena sp. CRU_2_10]
MAKRRNQKKEKALRNQAYARKFRKRTPGRFGRKRFGSNRFGDSDESDGESETSEDSEAAPSPF